MSSPTRQAELLPPKVLPLPGWMPADLRRLLAGRTVSVDAPRSVRRVLRVPEKIPVSQWSEQHRRVTAVDANPGPWRNDLLPHAVEIMDDYGKPWLEELWVCAVERSGKTNIMLNCAGWAIDCDPGNIFWLMPTEDAAGRTIGRKIIPMLSESPRLRRYLGDKQVATAKSLISLNNGINLFPAHANSASSMASFYGKHSFGDEVDKYPPRTGKEADPITLIRKRGRDKRGSKRFFASTPAQQFIAKGTQACHQVKVRTSRCPDCGEQIVMDQEHFVIPAGATAEEIEIGAVEIHYACNACGCLWDEEKRLESYHRGRYRITKGADNPRPKRIGYHIPAWPIPMVPMAEIAVAILAAQTGDLNALISLANGYGAIDYEPETAKAQTADHLLRYRNELPRNAVPTGTAMVVMLADTQQDSFYYQLWAVGYAPALDCAMIRHGNVQQFADLEHLLYRERYQDSAGREYRVQAGLIDSGGTRKGGQKHSRTVEVYEWCRLNPAMMPIKGIWSRRDGGMISYKTVDTYPGTNRKIPGGITRADIKVDFFKDELARRLAIEPDDPGALHYHQEIDADFARHYSSEGKDENGDWVHDKKKGRNDYFDCNVYLMALLEILRTRIPRTPEDAPAPAPQTQPVQAAATGGRPLPSWYQRR